MYLQRLILNNFKNYTSADLTFCDKINCFVGDNGEGKTNLLDAIHYLSFCKSFFNLIDTQNILHHESFFAIHGNYRKNGEQLDVISCILKRNQRKQFRLNKKDYNRLADHIGLYPLVMISPADSELITGGSEERRKYLDSVISQFDKLYLDDLINYNKALLQRNAYLRNLPTHLDPDPTMLEIWDEQMIRLGTPIHNKRKLFLESFKPIFRQYFEFITGGREEVSVLYESQLTNEPYRQILEDSYKKDKVLRYSTAGIHKDDLIFNLGGYPIKRYGSQGQQKSFLIALKLAQFDYTKQIKGFRPVLLFDDIFDKLDNNRVAQLIKLVSQDHFGQVFITETRRNRIEEIFTTHNIEHKIFEIRNGNVIETENHL